MIIDLIFLVLVVMALFKGYSRGFIVAIFSIAGFIIGLAAALKLSSVVAQYLSNDLHASGKWLPFLSFLLVFIAVLLLVKLGARLIQKSMEFVMLGWLNRLGGIVFFVLLYSVIYSVFLFYAGQMHLVSAETQNASFFYKWLQPLGPFVIEGLGTIIPWFKDMFAELQVFFGKMGQTKI